LRDWFKSFFGILSYQFCAEEDDDDIFILFINKQDSLKMKNIILNQNSLVPGNIYNNVFTSNFPSGQIRFENESVALSELTIYNSFYNITSATTGSMYNNNTFQYIWIDGTVVNVVLPDGAYEITDINAYLISVMTNNKHYLLNSSGEYVYYLDMSVSTTQYVIILTAYVLPSTLPSGWSIPSGATWILSNQTPQFTILPTNNFYKVIGFSAGTYPSLPQNNDYNVSSDLVPQVSPVSSIYLTLDIANNPYSIPSSFIYAFTTGDTKFGSSVSIRPPAFLWTNLQNGAFKNVTISFVDQDLRPIFIKDTNLVVILAVESNDKI
jgi:hypothetical protein